jgi:hypothetical protein
MQMFGNAQHALRVLGGTGVSGWHARRAACGGFEAAASRGIDRTRVEELGGEVTGPGTVGAVQPKMGVHDGQGDGAGGVGCSSGVSAQWGRGLGLCEVEADYRGSMDAPGRRVEGGGVKRWQGLGFPSPPRVQTVDDKRKGLQKSLDSKRRSSAGLSSLLVGL